MILRFKNIFAAGMVVMMLTATPTSAFARSVDVTPAEAVLQLEDGGQIFGGIYSAESDSQSACEAGGNATATISGTRQ